MAATEKTHAAARAAIKAWQQGDERARLLLVGLGEAAFTPLLESMADLSPQDQAWAAMIVTEAHLDARERLISVLQQQLQNKSVLQPPPFHSEIKPQSSRVCDEAYLLIRRVMDPTEETDPQRSGTRVRFLHLPENLRDREIARALKTDDWNRALYGPDFEPE